MPQPCVLTDIPWTNRGHNHPNRSMRSCSHPGQEKRSRRKRELQVIRQEKDTADARRLGISVDQLKQQRFDAVRPLLRNLNISGGGQARNPVTEKEVSRYGSRYFDCEECGHQVCFNGPGPAGCTRCSKKYNVKYAREY